MFQYRPGIPPIRLSLLVHPSINQRPICNPNPSSIQPSIHPSINPPSIPTYIHTYMHACTHTYLFLIYLLSDISEHSRRVFQFKWMSCGPGICHQPKNLTVAQMIPQTSKFSQNTILANGIQVAVPGPSYGFSNRKIAPSAKLYLLHLPS